MRPVTADATESRWRSVGDTAADDVVARLRAHTGWHRQLAGGRSNAEHPAGPPELTELFVRGTTLGDDVRPDALRRGAQWSQRNLPYLSIAMLCGSLPVLFLGAQGAAVLTKTRRMVDDIDRRINQTGAYVLDVVAPGAFDPTGRALRASTEVRLIHSLVRAEHPEGAVAICQQDLVLTLLAFAVVPVQCARRMGAKATDAEAGDYYALWRAVAPALGVDPQLVPPTFDDGQRLLTALVAQLRAPCPDGRLLAESLVAGMERHLAVPGLHGTPAWMVRYLLGDRNADVLGIPASTNNGRRWRARLMGSTAVAKLAPVFGRRVHRAIVRAKLATSA